ncbi:hypothetical protein TTHERM_00313680 (macronuclear) [Tetrahymena thermophila SB210]|uniref:Uncharacterized protein n=1 Tax=Tetrahymena thermophila (strain SB210) TaxID=312017 RepID=Q22KB3_TETTS|nr:hypothetical protein TTHERM_00313680 [Tetrahymena thermophila SB210]EAR85886.2 hypothetical protein TTHERM_00313680 [Tetrahymena thermophila SB210]|eukprot:XP_001033549.2 hypothetical protein TTHERM_00313680 [Tetrahymena thermophila SB210]
MEKRKGSLDTVAHSKDALYEDDIYEQPVQKEKKEETSSKFQKIQPDTILEQAEEFTQTKQEEQSQEEKDQVLISKMMQMMENLEQKYKSVKNEYVQNRESAKIELQIEKQLQNIEQIQSDLEYQIQIQKEIVDQADIVQDLQTGKDNLLLNLVSQMKKIQNQNENQQKQLLEKEQEEKRQKDEKIKELELMIQKLKEENENILRKSFQQSKLEQNSQDNNESPQQIKKKKFVTEGQKEIWLPQNELNSNDFSYFSSNPSNKIKLKPIHKSTIPHYEYIPPPKTNILQSSLNKELYKVAQSNRNVFLQAIKVDGTQRHKTPITQSKEKFQIYNTPQSEPIIGNKYRIKKFQLPQGQNQKNIFSNYLSTESLIFSRGGNFLHKNELGNTNAHQLRKTNQHQQSRDMNDFFFEKPNPQPNKY